jgi:hypothetical protein
LNATPPQHHYVTMQGKPTASASNLPERFFSEARSVLLQEAGKLTFEPADVLRIAKTRATRADFRRRFRQETDNQELREVILDFLEDVAEDMEDDSEVSEIKVDLVDRAGMAVMASVTGAAIVVIVVSGATLGSIVLLCGGLMGLTATSTSRTLMKFSSRRSRSTAKTVRRLIAYLGARNEQP